MKSPTSSLSLAFLAGISLVTPALATVNIGYVTVGNGGNANDTTGYGAVVDTYQIARNETTIGQYAEFLNLKAQSDPTGLYSPSMGSDLNIAGITRSGSDGSYSYSVVGSVNRPITYVSWFDAARFTNWLHNGQGAGSTETGAYTLSGATSGIFTKNVGATVWIPSESEWYKAAYYDPNKGGVDVGGYWAQATQSDILVSNTFGVAGAANYIDGDFAVTQSSSYSSSQNYLTDVGAYGLNSDSAYGINDQAGNVQEWNDAVIGSSRGLRGGSWIDTISLAVSSSFRNSDAPMAEDLNVGFRVASVPEPSAVLLTMLSVSACVTRRRRSTL